MAQQKLCLGWKTYSYLCLGATQLPTVNPHPSHPLKATELLTVVATSGSIHTDLHCVTTRGGCTAEEVQPTLCLRVFVFLQTPVFAKRPLGTKRVTTQLPNANLAPPGPVYYIRGNNVFVSLKVGVRRHRRNLQNASTATFIFFLTVQQRR